MGSKYYTTKGSTKMQNQGLLLLQEGQHLLDIKGEGQFAEVGPTWIQRCSPLIFIHNERQVWG